MTMTEPDTDKPVQSADRMNLEVFVKHMNFRHSSSMSGWTLSGHRMDAAVERCWRAFHRTLHRLRPDIEHEHGD